VDDAQVAQASAELRTPHFTDIGTIAPMRAPTDTGLGTSLIEKDIPGGSVLPAVVSAIFGNGNAAGLSPQQMDAIARPAAYGLHGDAGQVLAAVEGKSGTKLLRTDTPGLDVTVGGAGLGGPGRLRSRIDEVSDG
jgi:hypothetical protein